MRITDTSELLKYMLALYGKSGMGKTPLAATASKKCLFLDVEKRMMSLQGKGIHRTPVDNLKEAKAALKDKKLKTCKTYDTIIVDSASELARKHFKKLKKKYTDNKFEKYERIYDDMMDYFDLLKEMPQDIIVIFKIKPIELEGVELYRPLLPGKALIPEIPYLFDFVFPLRTWTNDEGEEQKFIQTVPNEEYEAKDTTGKLDRAEFTMDLSKLIKKARGK